MDLPHPDQFHEATRRDGWSPDLKARFLVLLADSGNVRLCARRCGLSPQSAYVQRRRDPLFARGWDGALVLARQHAEQVLADRAIEGVEEDVYYRGELVGTRRRYDGRLLLAHLARLDRQVEARAEADAGRFDELVALVAGAQLPDALTGGDDPLPPPRAEHLRTVYEEAQTEALQAIDAEDEDQGHEAWRKPCADPAEWEERVFAAGEAALARTRAGWREWSTRVDGVAGRIAESCFQASAQDSVNRSTSDALDPPRPGEGKGEGDHPQDGGGAGSD